MSRLASLRFRFLHDLLVILFAPYRLSLKTSESDMPIKKLLSKIKAERTAKRPEFKLNALYLYLAAVVVSVLCGFAIGQWSGFRIGANSLGDTARAYKQLKIDNNELTAQNSDYQIQFSQLSQETDAAVNNLTAYRDAVEVLRAREELYIKQTQALLGMLPSTMTPELEVISASVVPLPERAFEYQFDVMLIQPEGRPERTISADLQLINGESVVRVPLSQDRYQLSGLKRIEGRFIMPSGFTPTQLKLVLSGGGETLNKLYRWGGGEVIDSLPNNLSEVEPLKTTQLPN